MNTRDESPTVNPERWLDDHGDALYAFAMVRLRNPAVAEDVVQEAFLAAMKAKERFSGKSSERTWLTGILKHKIVDYFRKSSREKVYEDTEAIEAFEKDNFLPNGHWKIAPTNWGAHPSKSVERKEFMDTLQQCLGNLKPQHERAFTLREIEGLEGAEICDILDITESNLWVILYRARQRLRDCLQINWFKTPTEEAKPS